jgi:hypothetical protein
MGSGIGFCFPTISCVEHELSARDLLWLTEQSLKHQLKVFPTKHVIVLVHRLGTRDADKKTALAAAPKSECVVYSV